MQSNMFCETYQVLVRGREGNEGGLFFWPEEESLTNPFSARRSQKTQDWPRPKRCCDACPPSQEYSFIGSKKKHTDK